ncbi:hypothetical protein D3C80_981940 [compost metagenome]
MGVISFGYLQRRRKYTVLIVLGAGANFQKVTDTLPVNDSHFQLQCVLVTQDWVGQV